VRMMEPLAFLCSSRRDGGFTAHSNSRAANAFDVTVVSAAAAGLLSFAVIVFAWALCVLSVTRKQRLQ